MKNSNKDQNTTKPMVAAHPGHILHYRLIDLIGSGGMGEVYLAQDTRLDRLVALKILNERTTCHDRSSDRLKAEAKAAAKLSHPNICQIYAIEETTDTCFIVMEYIQGITIRKLIGNDQIDFAALISIAHQICTGIQAAHKQGIIHRDLKPSNLMINKQGGLKILDFGLAISASDEQKLDLAGTLPYMSPEQLIGDEIDYRSDFFSMGTILYELTTAVSPFAMDNRGETVKAILTSTPSPISNFRPELPHDWSQLISKLMEKEKDSRPQTTREISDQMNKFSEAKAQPVLLSDIQKQSIAIFPIKNVDNDPDLDYLTEGFSDELITRLSSLSHLRVASRSATSHFMSKNFDYSAITKKLNFSTYLSGRLSRSGNTTRLSVELVSVDDFSILWSELFTRDMKDMLSVQKDIFEQIVSALQVSLSGFEQSRLDRHREVDDEAYTLYLKARHHLKHREQKSLNKAVSFLSEALDRDPDFAGARAELATAYGILLNYGYGNTKELRLMALKEAERAIDIDPGSSQAHMSLCFILRYNDLPKTVTELRTAIALDPANYEAHHFLANLYIIQGHYQEAIREEQHALQLDPFQPMSRAQLFRLYFLQGEQSLADSELARLKDVGKSTHRYHIELAWMHWCLRDWAESTRHFDMAADENEPNQFITSGLSDCYRRSGNLEKSLDLLQQYLEQSKPSYILQARAGQVLSALGKSKKAKQYFVDAHTTLQKEFPEQYHQNSALYLHDKAWLYSLQNDKDNAFKFLTRAIENSFGDYIGLSRYPDWDNLNTDNRLQSIIKNLKDTRLTD